MKYSVLIAACTFVFVGGLGCAAAISQAKTAGDDITEDRADLETSTENTAADGIVPGNIAVSGEQNSGENDADDFFAGAGLQYFLDSLGTESVDSGVDPETIAACSEMTLLEEETPDQAENEYADLAIANVNNYVNVRLGPGTDSEVVGKIYNGAVAQILSVVECEDGDWFQVVSGNVEGYIKSDFFLYGDAAVAVIDDYVTRYAVVIADRLNVRSQPDLEASRVGYIDNGERVQILENQGEWMKVQYTDDVTGFVAAEYVTVSEEFIYAKTLEEEAKELAERRALEERQRQSEAQAAENTAVIAVNPPNTNYSSNSELRQEIVNYAMQYLGNRYIHGGQTLSGGTDCSGFTSLIYAEFGYSIGRTPASQLSGAGRGVDYSEIQPGDIICYGSSGTCTHVAMYIGDGQIIHSANSRKGVITGGADFDTILGIRNVID